MATVSFVSRERIFPRDESFILTASLYSSIKLFPISRKSGTWSQQVFRLHDPETPWHLQAGLADLSTACKTQEMKNKHNINRPRYH